MSYSVDELRYLVNTNKNNLKQCEYDLEVLRGKLDLGIRTLQVIQDRINWSDQNQSVIYNTYTSICNCEKCQTRFHDLVQQKAEQVLNGLHYSVELLYQDKEMCQGKIRQLESDIHELERQRNNFLCNINLFQKQLNNGR